MRPGAQAHRRRGGLEQPAALALLQPRLGGTSGVRGQGLGDVMGASVRLASPCLACLLPAFPNTVQPQAFPAKPARHSSSPPERLSIARANRARNAGEGGELDRGAAPDIIDCGGRRHSPPAPCARLRGLLPAPSLDSLPSSHWSPCLALPLTTDQGNERSGVVARALAAYFSTREAPVAITCTSLNMQLIDRSPCTWFH